MAILNSQNCCVILPDVMRHCSWDNMGLAQKIIFKHKGEDLTKVLDELGYKATGKLYVKRDESFQIELAIEPYGLHIHRAGQYFYELGLLLETLGNIAERITIEDK